MTTVQDLITSEHISKICPVHASFPMQLLTAQNIHTLYVTLLTWNWYTSKPEQKTTETWCVPWAPKINEWKIFHREKHLSPWERIV